MKQLHLFLFVCLATLLALGQLQRLSIGPFSALYLHDLLLVGWVSWLAVSYHSITKQFAHQTLLFLKSDKAARLLLAIVAIGWLAALATHTFPLWTMLFTLRLSTYLAWSYLMYQTKVVSKEWWQLGYLTAGVSIMVLGLLQYWLLPDTRFLSILGWDDHYYRLISTQLDPNFTGLILSIALFWWWETPHTWWQWLVHGLTPKQLKKLQQVTTLVISVLLLAAIGLTFSRASWISLVAGSLVLLKPKWSWSTVIGAALFLVAIIVAAPKATGEGTNLWRTSTISARVNTTSRWLNSLQSYQLVIGRGLFVPPAQELSVKSGISEDHANLPDNLLVLLVSGLGVAGTFTLVYLIATKAPTGNLDQLSWGVLTAVLAHSMFNNSLLQPFVLLFVLGTLIRAKKVTT